jgi:hypothetical protein
MTESQLFDHRSDGFTLRDVVTTASQWGIWLKIGEMLQIMHTNNSLLVIKKIRAGVFEIANFLQN